MHEKLKRIAEEAMMGTEVATEQMEGMVGYNTPDTRLRLSIAKSLAVIAATGIHIHTRLEFLELRERERTTNEDAFCQEMADLKKKGI